jgi:hypothetical protein
LIQIPLITFLERYEVGQRLNILDLRDTVAYSELAEEDIIFSFPFPLYTTRRGAFEWRASA